MIELTLHQKDLPETGSVYRRTAARGIIFQKGRLLLVHTDAGDYKFPGGGVEAGETPEAALAREVLEETGYTLKDKPQLWAVAHERRKGQTADILEMDSLYYLCGVGTETAPLNLDDYEEEEHFRPVWVEPGTALRANQDLQGRGWTPWLDREVMVLQALILERPDML